MKMKIMIFAVMLIVPVVFYGCLMGSQWFFVTSIPLSIYPRNVGPLNEMTLIANRPAGELVKVEKCYFDKDDAYLLVRVNAGARGYVFETKQRYQSKWEMPEMVFSKSVFVNKLTCWRLVGQFGLPLS